LLDGDNFKEHIGVYIKSLIAGLVVCLLCMLLFSIIMRFTPISEKWIAYYSLGIVAFSCLFSGVIAGYYKKRRGLLNGIIHSIILMVVLYIIYYFAVERISIMSMVHYKHLISLICGGIGGMLGVNAR